MLRNSVEMSELPLADALTLLDLRVGLGALVEDLPEEEEALEGAEDWVPLREEDLKAATAIGESSHRKCEKMRENCNGVRNGTVRKLHLRSSPELIGFCNARFLFYYYYYFCYFIIIINVFLLFL